MLSSSALALHLLPLYFMILTGYIAGRWLKVHRRSLATLLIYLLAPLVFGGAIATGSFSARYLLLPVVLFAVCTVISLSVYHLCRRSLPGMAPNLLALISGTANTGYFGVPVFLAVADSRHLGLYMLTLLGMAVFEASIGYYLLARGRFTVEESLKRVLRLPILYASLAGAVLNQLITTWPPLMLSTFEQFRHAYVIIGMMIIGLGLARVRDYRLDWRFIGWALGQRLLLWPLVVYGIIMLDRLGPQLLPATGHLALFLVAIVPLPANAVAFAAQLQIYPEKAATAVLLSTLLAMVTVPLLLGWYFGPQL